MTDIDPDKRRYRRLVGFFVAWGLALAVGLFVISAARPGDRPIIKITGIDAVSYYAVSRSLLFDHDFDLNNEYAALKPLPGRWNAVVPQTGLRQSPFPVGYSLLQTVFIFLGAVATKLGGGVADGYSQTCFTFYYIGNIVYVTLGLILLFHWLREVGRARGASPRESDWVAAAVALSLWPATTLGYYTFSSMSHVSAFVTFTAWLYAWWRARDTMSPARWALFGVCAGLNVLCRWQDALLLMMPVTYEVLRIVRGGGRAAIQPPRAWLGSRAAAVGAFGLMLTIQMAEWQAIYGSYFTIPQGGDMITLPPKHVLEVLFSSHNGWFVWTPIVFVGVLGLVVKVRQMSGLVVPILVALAVSVGFQGTVLTWHGDNYAMRMLTSSTALVAAGLALWLLGASRRRQISVLAVMGASALYTVVFGLQYRLDIVPKDKRLTFSELVVDKLRLPTVMKRRRAVLDAREQLEGGAPAQSLEILRGAEARVGADRNMLTALSETYHALGDATGEADADRRLRAIADAALF